MTINTANTEATTTEVTATEGATMREPGRKFFANVIPQSISEGAPTKSGKSRILVKVNQVTGRKATYTLAATGQSAENLRSVLQVGTEVRLFLERQKSGFVDAIGVATPKAAAPAA